MGDWAEVKDSSNFCVDKADFTAVCNALDAANGGDTSGEANPQHRLESAVANVIDEFVPVFDELGNWIGLDSEEFKYRDEQDKLWKIITPWVKVNEVVYAERDNKGNFIAFIEYEAADGHYQWCWSSGEFYTREGELVFTRK
jgi:hypothetical protein